MAGFFIAFEGPEGTGKTTQVKNVAEVLRTATGREVVVTREPGGSPLAEEIRGIILGGRAKGAGPTVELMLFNAARLAHLNEIILPAVARGAIVITDRYWDSTMAYQCRPHGLEAVEASMREILLSQTDGRARPDMTISLQADREVRLARRSKRGVTDRFEAEDAVFHDAVADAYAEIAIEQGSTVIDANGTMDEITRDCVAAILSRLK